MDQKSESINRLTEKGLSPSHRSVKVVCEHAVILAPERGSKFGSLISGSDAEEDEDSHSARAWCKWILNQPQFDWTMGGGLAKARDFVLFVPRFLGQLLTTAHVVQQKDAEICAFQ